LSEDGGPVDVWNEELETFADPSWLHGPWLFVECCMYRRLHDIISNTKYWGEYDVFKRQKDSTFKKSKAAITELAQRYRTLVLEIENGIKNAEAKKLLFACLQFI
jgi:damage-control phosphatase, subfamily III